jgi:hypothetical protein
MDAQRLQTRAIARYLRICGHVPRPILKYALRGSFGVSNRVPALTRRHLELYAFGPDQLGVTTSQFETNSP